MKIFYLPDLGEGLAEGEIVKWHVEVGDHIKVDQPLVAIETAKAVVEVPSPHNGRIIKINGKPGDIIKTGAPLVEFEGVAEHTSSTVAGEIKEGKEIINEQPLVMTHGAIGVKILPAVRALAKKLNVDLTLITPSGPDGTITAEDVQNTSKTVASLASLEPLRGARRTMALTMMQSHAQVVPVTVFEEVDISSWGESKDFSVRLIQALVQACQQAPGLNVWFDSQIIGRRLFSEVNIGLAIDTPEGLFVPVIHSAQQKSSIELRNIITQFKEQAEARSFTPAQLQGATIILSNFGKFAGKYATPIVVPPMVAILAAGVCRKDASSALLMPLSLTFDHRAVTGGEATRFLAAVIRELGKSC